MTEIIDKGIAISMLISGIYMTLVGFNIIKLKAKKAEDVEKMKVWHQKFDKFFKIGGITLLTIGIFLLIAPDSDNEYENWTLSQKEQMKEQIFNSSNFLKNMNPDTADLVLSCYVENYTEKFTLKEAWEQDKMTQEQIMEITMPIMKDCLNLYGIKTNQ